MEAGRYGNGYSYVRMGDRRNDKILVIPGVNDEMIRSTSYPLFLRYHFRGLLDHYRVVVASRKEGLESGKTVEEMAEEYREILEEEGKCHVLGVSLGGMIAQQLANRTEKIDKMVLGLTAAELGEKGSDLIKYWIKLLEEDREKEFYKQVIHDTFKGPEKHLYSVLARQFGGRVSSPPKSDLITVCEACLEHDASEALGRIENETLFIGAEHDQFFPKGKIEPTAEKIGAEIKYIQGGHAAFYQKHSQFHEKVLRFLDR